jgi:hypothetical protein
MRRGRGEVGGERQSLSRTWPASVWTFWNCSSMTGELSGSLITCMRNTRSSHWRGGGGRGMVVYLEDGQGAALTHHKAVQAFEQIHDERSNNVFPRCSRAIGKEWSWNRLEKGKIIPIRVTSKRKTIVSCFTTSAPKANQRRGIGCEPCKGNTWWRRCRSGWGSQKHMCQHRSL